jgi:hypothetical protein
MNKTLLAIAFILLLFAALTSIARAGGDQEYYDSDWGLITRFFAPKEIKPFENFTISFEAFHALKQYDLNVTATVEMFSGGAHKFENLLRYFILEKGQYEGGPAIVRNTTFKVDRASESYDLVTCRLQLYYAPVGSLSFKTASLESTLTWTSDSTYQELNTRIENDQNTIQSLLQNNETLTETFILLTIVLVAALGFVVVKHVKKTKSQMPEELLRRARTSSLTSLSLSRLLIL